MNTYCVKCRKDAENIDSEMFRTKNNRLIMQSKCPVCRIKKSRFIKNQEVKGLLSKLGIKIPLSKIPLLNNLFRIQFHWVYKMNEIVNKCLLVGDKFLPEMHLKQSCFTYGACGPFTKNKQRIENLCRLEIQILFIKMNLIRHVFNMIWLMAKQKI